MPTSEPPRNYGRRWERFEDIKLAQMVAGYADMDTLCRVFERTPAAIRERIAVVRSLGLLPDPVRRHPSTR